MTNVAVGIIVKDNTVLLCQRAATARYPLKWEFPGGKVENGEMPESCLKRELLEELGVHIADVSLYHQQHNLYNDGGSFNVAYYLVGSITGILNGKNIAQWQWVRICELPSYDMLEGNSKVVEKLVNELSRFNVPCSKL